MQTLIVMCLSILFTIFPVNVSAIEVDKPPTAKKTVLVEFLDDNLIQFGDEKFVLLPEVAAQLVFYRYINFPKLELKLTELSKLVNNYSQQLTINTKVRSNLEEQNTFFMLKASALEVELRKAKSTAWYKSTWFLITVGVVAGVATTIGIVTLVGDI